MTRHCRRCGAPYSVYRGGSRRYCSRHCQRLQENSSAPMPCAFCGDIVDGSHVCQVLEDHIVKQETG